MIPSVLNKCICILSHHLTATVNCKELMIQFKVNKLETIFAICYFPNEL